MQRIFSHASFKGFVWAAKFLYLPTGLHMPNNSLLYGSSKQKTTMVRCRSAGRLGILSKICFTKNNLLLSESGANESTAYVRYEHTTGMHIKSLIMLMHPSTTSWQTLPLHDNMILYLL